MKVFISWSGPMALAVAKVWVELIDETFDTVEAFISDDIEPGFRGLEEIKAELDGTSFAIVVITRRNENAPWLNFEAGAISRQFPGNPVSRVVPCLVDFTSPAQLTSPLKQFQARLLHREGVESILTAIATEAGLSWLKKSRQFDRAWSDYFEDQFNTARAVSESDAADGEQTAPAAERTSESMIEEVLELLREDRRIASYPTTRMPGKRLMDSVANDVRLFLSESVRSACDINVGLSYDPEDATGFNAYIHNQGLSPSELQYLMQKISQRTPIRRIFGGSDSEALDQVGAAQWRNYISYGGQSPTRVPD